MHCVTIEVLTSKSKINARKFIDGCYVCSWKVGPRCVTANSYPFTCVLGTGMNAMIGWLKCYTSCCCPSSLQLELQRTNREVARVWCELENIYHVSPTFGVTTAW